jgi:hypothetical protein
MKSFYDFKIKGKQYTFGLHGVHLDAHWSRLLMPWKWWLYESEDGTPDMAHYFFGKKSVRLDEIESRDDEY